MFFLLFLLDDGRLRSRQRIRMRIREAQKHTDPTDRIRMRILKTARKHGLFNLIKEKRWEGIHVDERQRS
jgi:DNA transposition AAA+ family ATPase